MSREDLAFAAGLFEGEGWFTLSRSKKPYPIMAIDQNDREPLDRFVRAMDLGHVNGPYGPYGVEKQPSFRWQVSGSEQVRRASSLIYEWLSTRRRNRPEEVLRLCATT